MTYNVSYYIVLLDYISYRDDQETSSDVYFRSSSYLYKDGKCEKVNEEEKVAITNTNVKTTSIHMNVVTNLDKTTDFILIYRPNLRFYKIES